MTEDVDDGNQNPLNFDDPVFPFEVFRLVTVALVKTCMESITIHSYLIAVVERGTDVRAKQADAKALEEMIGGIRTNLANQQINILRVLNGLFDDVTELRYDVDSAIKCGQITSPDLNGDDLRLISKERDEGRTVLVKNLSAQQKIIKDEINSAFRDCFSLIDSLLSRLREIGMLPVTALPEKV